MGLMIRGRFHGVHVHLQLPRAGRHHHRSDYSHVPRPRRQRQERHQRHTYQLTLGGRRERFGISSDLE